MTKSLNWTRMHGNLSHAATVQKPIKSKWVYPAKKDKEKLADGTVHLQYETTTENIKDVMTKNLGAGKHEEFFRTMGPEQKLEVYRSD